MIAALLFKIFYELRLLKAEFLTLLILSLFPAIILSQGKDDKILATVGNYKIKLPEFDERFNNYLSSTGVKDNIVVRNAILDNMINEILLFYYDDNENLLNNPQYRKELEESRLRIILAYLKDQEVYAKITVTEEEMREAFSRVNEEIAARHLFAKTEEEANSLYELVKIGVDFETLAKQVFTDSILQNNGGYLGYFTWGDMDPAFEAAAYALQIGEISLPVKTAYGYSIIKLEDRITNPLLTESEYQSKKSQLENVIKMRKKEPSEQEYLNKILNESAVSFNDETLRRILENFHTGKVFESDNFDSQQSDCVKYNNKVYSQIDIEQSITELPSDQRNRIISIENLKAAIKGILLKETLYNIAISMGYDTARVVLNKIEKTKMNIFFNFKKDEIISKAQLPDSVVFKYYKDNISLFSTEPELNLQEILVDNQELADSIVSLLNNGGDFGELAREFSLRKWSAENNGIMGYAPLSKFGNFKNLFWDTQLGEIIGPLKIDFIFGTF
ncbi:MAG: peptidylprolyl isomerase [Ignavibacteriaceae bacterium]|nr:peptidylprolyl isomerase [Ignavibacteriaceae bacterium]